MEMSVQFIVGNRVLINEKLAPATIEIQNGKIFKIHDTELDMTNVPAAKIIEAGDNVVMPGLIDTHTHVDEPGRTDWEGFWTATRAAAAGGYTTIVDMPLQCSPPTTTVANLNLKLDAARGKCHTDVKFWGGAIGNPEDMKELLKAGVAGFKCFLIDTGFAEYPHLNEVQADQALHALKGSGSVLMFHCELESGDPIPTENVESYKVLLESRPATMEVRAIELVSKVCRKNKDVRCHIVHLSATEGLPIIEDLKRLGYPITVETCPHYLHFSDEDIGTGWSEYLCLPPIRQSNHREALWKALGDGLVDMIAADHANCTPNRKPRDFVTCWGGIAGLQFGLPVVWTNARKRGFSEVNVWRWMSKNPSRLAGLEKTKGEIKVGYDADFVIWDPDVQDKIDGTRSQHKNKMTPYHGMKFLGKVHQTVVRGNVVYDDGIFSTPKGEFIFHKW